MRLFRGPAVGALVLIVVVIGSQPASADDAGFKEKLAKCFTQDWLRGFLPCATAKFESMIELLQPIFDRLLPQQQFGGRQLLSSHPEWASFLPPDHHRHTNKYHRFVSTVHDLHDEYQQVLLEGLEKLRPQTRGEHHRTIVASHLAQLDFASVVGEYQLSAHEHLATLQLLGHLANSSDARSQVTAVDTMSIKSVLEILAAWLAGICASNDLEEGLHEDCNNTVAILQCLAQQDTAAMEDSITWTRCIYQCRDLPVMSSCVVEQFTTNLDCELPWPIKDLSWLAPVATKLMTGYLQLEDCTINIISPSLTQRESGLTLVEGSPPQTLAFTMYMPPAVYCINPKLAQSPLGLVKGIAELITRKIGKCDVTVHITTHSFIDVIASKIPSIPLILPSGGGVPTCLSGNMRRQAVLGVSPLANATLGAGKIPITEENWNETFHVPLVATTDSIPGGGISDVALGFRLKAGLRFHNITRVPLKVEDPEKLPGWFQSMGTRTCFAYGRGHVITHRDAYYNNFYEGHFYLYKHDTLPYEVQAVYQSCSGSSGTCACAVAVLFGNDVFVLDKCRRKKPSCDVTGCDRLVRSILYQNGDITPNTRIYRKYDGLKFQVLLPLGTLVTIDVHDEHLSAFIRPSASDLDSSKGLCGVYAQSGSNQLVAMPDGTQYTIKNDVLPREFIKAWRVPEESQLIQGAAANTTSADSTRYCSCTHVLYMGSRCTCGDAFRTETCDMDTDGDMSANISQIAIPSVKQYIEETGEDIADVLDIDLEYEPEDPSWDNITVSQSHATQKCQAFLAADPAITRCKADVSSFSYQNHIKACVDNIMASNSTEYVFTTVEAVRQKCRDWTYRDKQKKLTLETLSLLECPNDCHGQGECVNGTCQCSGAYAGPSCAIPSGARPQVVMPNTVLCDSRHEDCAWAKIFGYNFHNEALIQVEAVLMEVDSSGSREVGPSGVADALVLTPTQAAARLPSEDSYRIHVRTQASRSKRDISSHNDRHSFTYMVFDPQCYRCDVLTQSCTRKKSGDHCLIGGTCLAPLDLNPSDSCYVCDPHQDRDDWAVVDSETCLAHHATLVAEEEQAMRARTVRIICAFVLSCTIVVITLVLYLLVGRKSREAEREKVRTIASIHRRAPAPLTTSNGLPPTQAVAYDNKAADSSDAFGNPVYQSMVSVVSDADYSEAL